MSSIFIPLEQQLFPPDRLDQSRLDLLIVLDKVIRSTVAHVTRGGEVLKVSGNGQERGVVGDDHVDLDRRVGSSGEEGVSASEAETYGDDLAAA